MLDAIAGIERWSKAERAAVIRIVRAKGGASEIEYAARFGAHAKLARSIAALT